MEGESKSEGPEIFKGTQFLRLSSFDIKELKVPQFIDYFLNLLDVRGLYETCMDTETLKKQGLTEVQEIIARLGGWPVVQGEEWKGEKNFKWFELVIKAAGEGSSPGDFMNIGKVVFTS